MTSADPTSIADALVRARRDHTPAATTEPADAAAAYAVQDRMARDLGWFHEGTPRHWKSGGARGATPTHAPLPPAGVWASPAQAGAWPFHLRGIEAEVALRLGRDVAAAHASALDADADANPDAALAWIDAMAVSIEVVDSRWQQGLAAPALCKLADLQSHGALVLGPWVPFVPRDWAAQDCRVRIGTQPLAERRGTHPLGDPVRVLPAWLRHATARFGSIAAGTVVTTGSWVGILHAAAGDRVTVEFPGVGQASLQL